MTNSENSRKSASLWRRLAAIIYDSTLVFAIWMVVGYLILAAFGISEARTLEGEIVVLDPLYERILFAAMLLSAFAFFSWFWTHSGQTLGMQAWKIKIQNTDGSAISLKQCLIRFFIAPFSFICLGLGFFIMLVDKNGQTFHDKLSSSEVIKVKR